LIDARTTARSEASINELRSERGGSWRAIRWIHRRRPVLTAVIVVAAAVHTVVTDTPPFDLLVPNLSARFVLAWLLVALAVVVRLWGAGNQRKNQEITDTGIYRLVRHPLYLGNLSFLLAYFLTVGDVTVGLALFVVLVCFVYYPTMLGEEEYLSLKFPQTASEYHPPPRLLPDPTRLREALGTDRFTLRTAHGNLGFRSLWFVVALPLVLRFLASIQSAL
jgi:protein-S-isoprenylcysteine O-methyltransferase Ste14